MKKLLLRAALLASLGAEAQQQSPYTATTSAVTVTNSSAVAVAANYTRRYLAIQNNHASANIFCTSGGTATTTTGVKIAAGQMWAPYMPTMNNAIACIGDTASNTTVTVVEGN